MPRVAGFANRRFAPYSRPMTAALYMDAVLTPNRSLPKRGFYWLIGLLIAFNLIIGALFVSMGALPVPIFLGLDVLGVIVAFRASYRGARQAERVQVSADQVRVLHQVGRHARTVWSSPTAFTRVAIEAAGEHEARVRLRLSDRSLTVGAALSPLERGDFAVALERAILQARAERH
jgi:uncharacterized membrane protein